MTFKTAVWLDPATEQFCARIFPDTAGIDLAAWGLAEPEPIDVAASGIQLLGFAIEDALHRSGLPTSRFEPIWLGAQPRGADIRAELEAKLAAVAA